MQYVGANYMCRMVRPAHSTWDCGPAVDSGCKIGKQVGRQARHKQVQTCSSSACHAQQAVYMR
jgi:hypothetical protein